MDKDALEALIATLDNWAAIFTLLVVVGVGGELIVHIVQSRTNKKLIALQHSDALAQEAEIARLKKDSGSFELDIAKANKGAADALQQAAKAQENLGNAKKDAALALQHAAEANRIAEEERLKRVQIEERLKPRSLNHESELILTLSPFKGTEYTFSSIFQDEESIMLLRGIDNVLNRAGWKRVKPPHRFPMINVYGDSEDFAVPSGISTGVRVSVDSLEPLATLQSLPLEKLPPPIRAAVALNLGLASSLSPPQVSDNKLVDVQPGTSVPVRIAIGKKP